MEPLAAPEIQLLSDILYRAYRDTPSTDAWSDILDMLSRLIPADFSAILVSSGRSGEPDFGVTRGLDPAILDEYRARYHEYDYPEQKALSAGSYTWLPTHVMSQSEYEKSEFYAGFLKRYNFHRILRSTFCRAPGVYGRIGLGRTPGSQEFSARDVELMKLLRPHFENAFQKAGRIRQLELAIGSMQAATDQFHRPLLMFSDDMDLLYMNHRARALCEDAGGNRNLSFTAIADATREIMGKLHGPPSQFDYPAVTHVVLNGSNYMIEASPSYRPDGGRQWLTTVVALTDHLMDAIHRSVTEFGLTQREADICYGLAEGLTNQEIAEKLFITEYTVKDHVKSILQKLGVSSRSEVATRLLGY